MTALAAVRQATMAWTNSDWTNNDDVRWEPGETSLNAGPIIAALIVVFAIADFFIGWAQGAPILRIFAFVAAAAVWLIGRALRALLS